MIIVIPIVILNNVDWYTTAMTTMAMISEDMVVDLRLSWPSSASLDFRLQTDNTPKAKLRLDRFDRLMLILYD